MPTAAAQLQTILRRALAALPDAPADTDATVTPAADTRFGDYQANAAMTLAKARRTNPRALAAQIVALLNADPALAAISAPADIAGPGFINFRLKAEFLAGQLAALDADAARLGLPLPERPLRIVIDFSSPNVAKPMHVGHLRSTVIGECLARVARFIGHDVLTDNHLGDWGTQFGKVIYGWKHFLDEKALAADPLAEMVRIYQETNQRTDQEQRAYEEWRLADEQARRAAWDEYVKQFPTEGLTVEQRILHFENFPREGKSTTTDRIELPSLDAVNACRAELAKLQSGDPENLAIWQQCVDLSRAENDRIYARLDAHFDMTLGESFFNPKLAGIVDDLERRGIAQVSEGALVVFFPDDPRLADKPAIIRKRDGAFNYATTDIATYEYRVNEMKRDTIWVVVGSPQALHFEQLNAIVRRMDGTVPITHVPFGTVLGEDRKIMRTRSGENVALKDLLDEAVERARAVVHEKNAELPDDDKAEIARIIGLGAVKYAELSQHRMTDYVFSWDRMLSFQGNTAPYLQNAYVRIQGIFRRLDGSGESEPAGVGALTQPAELQLAKKLAQFAETVPTVLDDFRPNLLANYLYELANDFHSFYEACPVLKATDETRATRLTLCRVTARTLRLGLGLLGIEVPERM